MGVTVMTASDSCTSSLETSQDLTHELGGTTIHFVLQGNSVGPAVRGDKCNHTFLLDAELKAGTSERHVAVNNLLVAIYSRRSHYGMQRHGGNDGPCCGGSRFVNNT